MPHPYPTPKPNGRGRKIIKIVWMQSFIHEVEHYVLHYLHSLCPDKKMKKRTSFNIELAKNITPECLCLDDSFLLICPFLVV